MSIHKQIITGSPGPMLGSSQFLGKDPWALPSGSTRNVKECFVFLKSNRLPHARCSLGYVEQVADRKENQMNESHESRRNVFRGLQPSQWVARDAFPFLLSMPFGDFKNFCNEQPLCQSLEAVKCRDLQGIHISPDIFSCLLRRCIVENNLAAGREAYHLIVRSELDSDTYLGSLLIHMFSLFESLVEVKQVFGKLLEPDLFSWTAVISAHSKLGQNEEAIKLYHRMHKAHVDPDGHVFVAVIKACSNILALEHGKSVHVQIVERGFESDAYVVSSLLDMYVKCGSLNEAGIMFDRLANHNIVTWSVLIAGYAEQKNVWQALRLFQQMQEEGMTPDRVTFLCILKACCSTGALEQGRQIHAHIVESGFDCDVVIGSSLIDMYGNCGSLKDAHMVFDRLPKRNVVIWNALMTGYAQLKDLQAVFQLFKQMQEGVIEADMVTFLCILKVCSNNTAIERGKEIHANIIENGLDSNVAVGSAIVDMYGKCGKLVDARMVFERLPVRSVVTWSALIAGYTQHEHAQEALIFFQQMREDGLEADSVTFVCILKACSGIGSLKQGKHVHTLITENGTSSNVFVGSALINMYTKCGSLEDARIVFDRLPKRDVAAWSTLIAGYAQHEHGQEAFQLFEQMQQEGIDPDPVTLVMVLKACSSIAALEKGRKMHAHIIETGLESEMYVGSTLIDTYGKCGSLEDAPIVFHRLPLRNVVTWSALITCYAQHNNYPLALRYFLEMQQAGLKPDDVTYVCLLSACSHEGLVNEGCLHLKSMQEDHGITPRLDHYNSMVDLLGRAGCLHEAEDLLEAIPFQTNILGWISLLSSCRTNANVELGKRCFDQISSMDCGNSAAYTLVSNIFAHTGMQEEVEKVEDLRRRANLWKKPAKAYIEIDDHVHEFLVGDKTHPRSDDIYAKLKTLSAQMGDEGYKPQLQSLNSSSDDYKEDSLCGHCEKLAIALGLICTPKGTTVRVAKNLRMCADCHAATKVISRIEMRQILVKDSYCIHNFIDGVCSCKD